MKIFALQTDVNVLRNQYMIHGEEELLVTHCHWISFVIHTYRRFLLAALACIVYFIAAAYTIIPVPLALLALLMWSVFIILTLIDGYIRYKLNFMIITSEKVVLIHQKFLFSQHVDPMRLSTIVSTDVKAQLLGIFNCGRVIINLTERSEYSSKKEKMDYLPRPNTVAGIIENAIVLDKHRKSEDASISEQETEINELQKQAETVTVDEPMEPKGSSTDKDSQ